MPVVTKVLLWQTYVLLQQNICHDKYLSRQTILSWQMFCCDKHTFVVTKHIFCCDKSMSWQSYELSVRVVAVVLTRCGWRWKSGDPGRWAALLYPELTVCQSYPWMESETRRHTTPTSSTDTSCFTSNALPFCVIIMKHHLCYQCELLLWWNTVVPHYDHEASLTLLFGIIITKDYLWFHVMLKLYNVTFVTVCIMIIEHHLCYYSAS